MPEYTPKALIPDCKLFSGYKPCLPYKTCEGCPDPQPFGKKILIINLDNIGAVLMNTAQLPLIKKRWPHSTIFWLTQKASRPVLENNPYLHAIYEWNDETRLILRNMKFDVVLNGDKNRNSSAFTNELTAYIKLGFGLNAHGAIIPLNAGAEYNYHLGTHDYEKFRINKRTGQDILAETWELPYERTPYVLKLTDDEKKQTEEWRHKLGLEDANLVVGINVGCSSLYPLKRLTARQQAALVSAITAACDGVKIILLGGGPEDAERAEEIAKLSGGLPIVTPMQLGLRTGIVLENLADVVISGDSLGMHIAIALRKYVIAWFGLSCAAEIDLYDNGVKLIRDLPCAPCWKKSCELPQGPICVNEFDLNAIVEAVVRYYRRQDARRSAQGDVQNHEESGEVLV